MIALAIGIETVALVFVWACCKAAGDADRMIEAWMEGRR